MTYKISCEIGNGTLIVIFRVNSMEEWGIDKHLNMRVYCRLRFYVGLYQTNIVCPVLCDCDTLSSVCVTVVTKRINLFES